ncbi:GlsB/YeaQ/YmgE family stress response membrane protein [Bacillus sp. NPDC094077]|uniref:GlsB/YeaQ/YmgE family stress response membrane protein n=1 Tax=Bacillus sp. NPDC094077 TaxID=3390932 RepID=UPI003D075F54
MIGTIAVSITGKDFPARMFGNIIACLLGVWLGDELLSFVRWYVYIGAIVLIFIVSFIVKVARI